MPAKSKRQERFLRSAIGSKNPTKSHGISRSSAKKALGVGEKKKRK